MSVSTIDFYCLTLVGEEYRQNYGGKLLNPPGLSNIDEIDFWLHGLQIWQCVIFHFQTKLEAPVETM